MEDLPAPPLHRPDVRFETSPGSYEVRFSDRIAREHADLVDQFADWMEEEVGAVNLGQIDHEAVLADGVLGAQLQQDIVGWWAARVRDFDPG